MERLASDRIDRAAVPPLGRLFAPFALVFVAAACGGLPPRATPSTPVPTQTESGEPCVLGNPWDLTFDQTGGIAGLSRSLQVASSGEALARDQRMGREVSFQLLAAERANLEAALSSVCGAALGTPPPNCADCFQYAVRLEGVGGRFEFLANDAGLAGHPGAELIDLLRSMLEEALVE